MSALVPRIRLRIASTTTTEPAFTPYVTSSTVVKDAGASDLMKAIYLFAWKGSMHLSNYGSGGFADLVRDNAATIDRLTLTTADGEPIATFAVNIIEFVPCTEDVNDWVNNLVARARYHKNRLGLPIWITESYINKAHTKALEDVPCSTCSNEQCKALSWSWGSGAEMKHRCTNCVPLPHTVEATNFGAVFRITITKPGQPQRAYVWCGEQLNTASILLRTVQKAIQSKTLTPGQADLRNTVGDCRPTDRAFFGPFEVSYDVHMQPDIRNPPNPIRCTICKTFTHTTTPNCWRQSSVVFVCPTCVGNGETLRGGGGQAHRVVRASRDKINAWANQQITALQEFGSDAPFSKIERHRLQSFITEHETGGAGGAGGHEHAEPPARRRRIGD